MTKTLLRYPGGKSRAIKILNEYLPEGIDVICSPFFGGGSFELSLMEKGVKVFGYDIFTPLVEFWQMAIEQPTKLAEEVQKYHPLSKEKFYELQKEQFVLKTKLERAAVFYVINRASFSGSTLSGGMSPGHPRFNGNSITRLKEFQAHDMSVESLDFKYSIEKHKNDFLYLDPPYYIENHLYGKKGDAHKNFDHEGLAKILKKRRKWMLSYNNCDHIKELYKGYEFVYPSWSYGMSNDKESKEILILNY